MDEPVDAAAATRGRGGDFICVELARALPTHAVAVTYRIEPPATLSDLARRAAADPAFADIDFAQAALGIFGRIASGDQILRDGDRVEIYRPLAADPKTARRARAKATRRQRQ